MRKTKIICTLGPSSNNEEVIRNMILAGMNVARLNFSHGDYESHKKTADIVKKLRAELHSHTALLLDTKGPEIRLKKFKDKKVTLKKGQNFTLMLGTDEPGSVDGVAITYDNLYKDIKPGNTILVDDGLIALKVQLCDEKGIECIVENGGQVSDNKGVNIPGVKLSMPFISKKDAEDIAFGVREDFDFIAASFTQSAEDIHLIHDELEKNNCRSIRVIAKIENAAGVENIDEILDAADGIMVARGDMGAEIAMEEIPIIQKRLISKGYNDGKQVITATQMLESMTRQPRPTRAEITDVANAIYDGTSAIMLSGETASGLYPVEAVKTMARIAIRTERDIDYAQKFSRIRVNGFSDVTSAISHATCTTANDLNAAAIITVTKSGRTARMLSRFRPATPIIGCSPDLKTCRHMNLSWGITPLLIDEKTSTDELLEHTISVTTKNGLVNHGDVVVITAGIPLGVSGTTNMMKVQIVGNVLVGGTGIGEKSVCGNLCVCDNEEEALEKFRAGDIRVIPFASQKLIDILKTASAIVCERFGMDSYAAVAGQLLGCPVIIGAVGATKILHSGTVVTVDAKNGVVYSGDNT